MHEGMLCKETHENVIRFAPPLVITKKRTEPGAAARGQGVREARRLVGDDQSELRIPIVHVLQLRGPVMRPSVIVLALVFVVAALGLAASGHSGPEGHAPMVAAAALLTAARADTFAWRALEELCDTIGPRPAGSQNMQRAIAWAQAAMTAAGCDSVWTEPVTVPRWVRGQEWARLTSPCEVDLAMAGLGRSVGTPPEGIEAEVIAVADFDELEVRAAEVPGKIVLFDPPWVGYGPNVQYRVHGASRAAKLGAVACLIRPAGTGQNTAHTGVMRYDEGVAQIPAASLTIEGAARLRRLCQRGAHPRARLMMQARNLEDGPCFNTLGELRGRELPDQIVLLGAHLDAWDTGAGAQDDGGGCAIMLGAVKLLHDLDLRPRRTVRVVLFTSEEYGGQGGDAYRDAHQHEHHVAALESDSGCFAPAGFSVQSSPAVVEHVAALAAPLADLGAADVTAGGSGVDVEPLVATGVPGLGHRTHNEAYFNYHHSPADALETISPDDLSANVAAVAALVLAIGDDPVDLLGMAASTAAPDQPATH